MKRLFLLIALTISMSNVGMASEKGMDILENQCASCHHLNEPAPTTLKEIWQRKGPDFLYAGNKYRQAWLKQWLQNPKRIRPAGMFYGNHIQPGEKRDVVLEKSLEEHIKLNENDASAVAEALMTFKANSELVEKEKHDSSISPGPLGEMLFDKIYGCLACHQIEPGYGGLSAPEVYTAGRRLKAEYMLSYIRSPQAWDPKTWMPNSHLPDNNMQKLVNYMIKLSQESFNE